MNKLIRHPPITYQVQKLTFVIYFVGFSNNFPQLIEMYCDYYQIPRNQYSFKFFPNCQDVLPLLKQGQPCVCLQINSTIPALWHTNRLYNIPGGTTQGIGSSLIYNLG